MSVEISIDGWDRVKEAALFTVGLKAIADKPISSEWKTNILMSRHSPIRELRIKVVFRYIERWVADQLVRV